jgi:hypothetical protein
MSVRKHKSASVDANELHARRRAIERWENEGGRADPIDESRDTRSNMMRLACRRTRTTRGRRVTARYRSDDISSK